MQTIPYPAEMTSTDTLLLLGSALDSAVERERQPRLQAAPVSWWSLIDLIDINLCN
jgi:hypothetical protein